ncbi:PIG-L family deacetylase [Lysinibacillus fusiformis]|nr:PIG-L family deacetylase [Lysinibacillus fusiformis]
MSKNIVVVTPHPDDETLGCGGTLLKYKEKGYNLYWLIVTGMGETFTKERKQQRQNEIDIVTNAYDFKEVFQLDFPTAELDHIPMGDIIGRISQVFSKITPHIVFTPYPGDIHSDHKVVFDATMSCTKWFRYPSVERVLAYETLSETDFSINPDVNGFRPNVYINIDGFLEEKIRIMNIYASEISAFPFPRSEKAIRSLAYLRGVASGYEEAEAFMLLKERVE